MSARAEAGHGLSVSVRGGGTVSGGENGSWHLSIPAGDAKAYRLAQLDDAQGLGRGKFRWRPPCTLVIEARVSAGNLPGTWGFGFWNAPFSVGSAPAGERFLLPALPQCAWFFSGSPPNHLSFYDGVPGSGFFAGAIRSKPIPVWLLAPGLAGLPLLLWKPAARFVRRMCRLLLSQQGAGVDVDPAQWHTYRIDWRENQVGFKVDSQQVLSAETSPSGPLSLVIWIDNQYAAFAPDSRVGWGILPNPACWLEVKRMDLQPA